MRKLGIVIPTYNRGYILESTLKAIMPQIVKHRESVSVIVCDNASVDNTMDIIKTIMLEYPEMLEYYRHNENKGYLFNFAYGIQHVDAEYVFLYGSDDIAPPTFLECIFSLLESYPEMSLFHFNYMISDMDGSPIRLVYKIFDNEMICIYNSGEEFIKHHFDIPSFMSSIVFKKEIWIRALHDESQNDCYAYEWFYIIYKGLLGNNKCLFYSCPIFIQRMSKYESYSHRWSWFSIVGISRVFENLSPDIYDAWKQYRNSYSKPKMLRNLASVYLDKPFYKERITILMKYVDGLFYKSVLLVCLYFIPSIVTKYIFLIAKKLLKR